MSLISITGILQGKQALKTTYTIVSNFKDTIVSNFKDILMVSFKDIKPWVMWSGSPTLCYVRMRSCYKGVCSIVTGMCRD